MTEVKWTKGPWITDCVNVWASDGTRVAGEIDCDTDDGYLISAAPELAEALDMLLHIAEDKDLRPNLQDILNARAALRKARGEKE